MSRRGRQPELARGPAAVDDDGLAGDVAAGVAGEPQHGAGEVFDGALVRQRGIAVQPRRGALVFVHRPGELAAEEAGGDRVHPDAVPGPLDRELDGEAGQAKFARGIAGLRYPGDADLAADRGDIDDRAAPGGGHVRVSVLGEPEGRYQVEVEG